ncbi:N-fatty-acyl-amino acid synthase/hydrolase PM20D1 [Nematostella vectensis]|uniref:N-fatty-acyl-amino acid synthase/hydrolase PM20D1 n=1 Tax=Nematostella vectensis TaxID=45351 RepID=UPI002076DE41|nr:N-fatty-acyl-amino acid synthase/hydrolase PM20D1 [Nematostella vectensis]
MAFRIINILLASFLALALILVIRTLVFTLNRKVEDPCLSTDEDFITADSSALERFSQALRYRTVAWGPGDYNRTELLKFKEFILREFSYVFHHPLVTFEVINNYSLLIQVHGSNSTLRPYMIASHLDVVPAPGSWDVPPFDGRVKDGYIWGRGTLDVKNGVMASLEAVQALLKLGQKPKRSFYLAYGHDEEVQGADGARNIGMLLKARNIKLEFIVDEGMVIVKNVFPGLTTPYAIIGVAEKGYMMVELSVHTSGGHASMPPKESSIGILSKAIARLESCPCPAHLSGQVRSFFEELAPKVSFPIRIILANIWLFKFLLISVLGETPSTNSMIRTTTAVTMFKAGVKGNVIAPDATATVNHRVHPENTIGEVVEHDRKCIGDNRVHLRVTASQDPSPVSSWDSHAIGYQAIAQSVRQVFPGVGVAPGLMIANTDTKHYLHLTDAVYRFMPSLLEPSDLKRIHGVNERIGVKNYEQTINYYYHLIRNTDLVHSRDRLKSEL